MPPGPTIDQRAIQLEDMDTEGFDSMQSIMPFRDVEVEQVRNDLAATGLLFIPSEQRGRLVQGICICEAHLLGPCCSRSKVKNLKIILLSDARKCLRMEDSWLE